MEIRAGSALTASRNSVRVSGVGLVTWVGMLGMVSLVCGRRPRLRGNCRYFPALVCTQVRESAQVNAYYLDLANGFESR
jgi:hypothetical protein